MAKGNSRPREKFTQPKEDLMDGAYYPTAIKGTTPADFTVQPGEKYRPGEKQAPVGKVKIKLDGFAGALGVTLPPRSVWSEGYWEAFDATTATDEEWRTWVVSGEGTPGNWESRLYIVPAEIAKEQEPSHPADWPKVLREGKSKPAGTGLTSFKPQPKASSQLPRGVVAICPGCGHYFDIDDLVDHAKGDICPSKQGELVAFIMPCECHPKDLQTTAKIMPGFPYKPKVAKPTTTKKTKEKTT
jgi:hypothetical protein